MKRSKKKRLYRIKKLIQWFEKSIEYEVVEAQKAKGLISTTTLVEKIYIFCELYSNKKLYPYQEQFGKRIIRSVLENDGEELTALFARQMGKTETVAVIVGGLMIILPRLANLPMFATDTRFEMFKDGFWVGIFAPSLRQAQTTYGRMKGCLQCDSAIEVLNNPDFGYNFSTSNGQTVALTNGSFATAVSASEGSNIEGDSYKLIICEECQDISEFKILKSIHPMGASYNATLVKIGTATTHKGNFYHAIERNKKNFKEGHLRIRNHFEYDYTIGIKYNPRYEKYVKKEKARMGEFSDEFRMSYKLEWILSRGMFIDPETFEKVNGQDLLDRVMTSKKPCVVGIDLAKKEDSTVITPVEVDWENPVIVEKTVNSQNQEDIYKAYETCIQDWKEIQGDDYDQQYYEIMDYLSNFNVKRIMIDATKEEGMADRMRANLRDIDIVPCIFSASFKSDMYKYLDSEIKTGRAKYPSSKETKKTREYQKFLKQMIDLQKEWKGQTLFVSHPDKAGAHDDFCLSLNTEILTKRGFLKYNEIKENDLVAKVIDNKITYVKPNKIILKEYEGEMYRFSSKDLCLEVTKNHKMLVRNRKSGEEEIMLSQELARINSRTRYNTLSIPVAPIQYKEDYPISDELIKQFIITEDINRIPRNWLNEFSQRQLKLLLDTLMLGDKTLSINTYDTNSLELAQDFQELAHKLGIKTYIRKYKDNDYVRYTCYLMQKNETRIKKVKEYNYTGKVWCVNVDNGFILTRCNNKISVTGNCDSWALAVYGTREACDIVKIEVVDKKEIFNKTDKIKQIFYRKRNRLTARRR